MSREEDIRFIEKEFEGEEKDTIFTEYLLAGGVEMKKSLKPCTKILFCGR